MHIQTHTHIYCTGLKYRIHVSKKKNIDHLASRTSRNKQTNGEITKSCLGCQPQRLSIVLQWWPYWQSTEPDLYNLRERLKSISTTGSSTYHSDEDLTHSNREPGKALSTPEANEWTNPKPLTFNKGIKIIVRAQAGLGFVFCAFQHGLMDGVESWGQRIPPYTQRQSKQTDGHIVKHRFLKVEL